VSPTGTGSVSSSAIGSDAHGCIVNLTGVTNADVITFGLTNVNDSAGNFGTNVSGSLSVLIGDVNTSTVVTSGDTNLCREQALQPVTIDNFRNDINANGVISNTDVSTAKTQVAGLLQ
jgi:hypothetical protein